MEQKIEQRLNNKRKFVDALKWVYTYPESKNITNSSSSNAAARKQSDIAVFQGRIPEERSGIQIAVMIYGDIPKVISFSVQGHIMFIDITLLYRVCVCMVM
jgi:hypothetical protein